MKKRLKHLLTLKAWSKEEILGIISLAEKIKKNPKNYKKELDGKTLLMMFAKPSLRTYLSFDIAMHQLGGHAIFYDISHSTLGKKESIKDFSKVVSRYVNVIVARLYEHKQIEELARYSDVPVINGLTNDYHPCQVLGDLLTIKEKFKSLKNIKIVYFGDANNNVTHSLIILSNKIGLDMYICCPNKKEFLPNKRIIGNIKYNYEKEPKKAVHNASVIYTDSWMSYQIPKSQEKRRLKILKPYQVTKDIIKYSKENSIFMHCLPAHRGEEVTDEIMDSEKSVIYNQAENRLHTEKAILLKLLKKA